MFACEANKSPDRNHPNKPKALLISSVVPEYRIEVTIVVLVCSSAGCSLPFTTLVATSVQQYFVRYRYFALLRQPLVELGLLVVLQNGLPRPSLR
jgi:hypothetical protein